MLYRHHNDEYYIDVRTVAADPPGDDSQVRQAARAASCCRCAAPDAGDHSIFAPARLITASHFGISLFTSAANSAGVPPEGSKPMVK